MCKTVPVILCYDTEEYFMLVLRNIRSSFLGIATSGIGLYKGLLFPKISHF